MLSHYREIPCEGPINCLFQFSLTSISNNYDGSMARFLAFVLVLIPISAFFYLYCLSLLVDLHSAYVYVLTFAYASPFQYKGTPYPYITVLPTG